MLEVVCFGEILWDNFPTGKKPGGAPLNVALHLFKHGVKSIIISSTGNDADGRELRQYILNSGLSDEYIQLHSQLKTGIVDVTLDEQKQASYEIVKPVAWDAISFDSTLAAHVAIADALVFGSLACRSATSFETLSKLIEKSPLPVFDMNLRPPHFNWQLLETLMSKCKILKINEHELDYLRTQFSISSDTTEGKLKYISSKTNIPTICLTLGDKGAAVYNKGEFTEHPGYKINVADTVGAGDAFLAAFLSGYLHGKPMPETLALACASGAVVASRPGANPEYSIAEVHQLAALI